MAKNKLKKVRMLFKMRHSHVHVRKVKVVRPTLARHMAHAYIVKGGVGLDLCSHAESGRRLKSNSNRVWNPQRTHTKPPLSLSLPLQVIMATGSNVLEDSLGSPLDYDAEVAYISATSPKPREELKQSTSKSSLRDFDFSSDHDAIPAPNEVAAKPGAAMNKGDVAMGNHAHEKKISPHKPKVNSLTLMNDPKLRLQPADKEKLSLSPPAQVQAAHYTLDTEATLPGTPKSRLRQIKEAQESPLAAIKQQKFKFGESQYKTLIVYGTTGCGRTHLAQKLVHSNPAVFAKVISSTTRKRRPSELDGVDFHFVSHEEMSAGIVRGDFLEYIQVR